jgi:hypothetical protein
MNLIQKTILLFISVTFVSCDPGFRLFYHVENASKSEIIVHYSISKYDTSKTTIIIPAGHSQIIYYDGGLGLVDECEKEDSIQLEYISIEGGSLKSKTNYKETKNWNFQKINKTEAWFNLIVK